MRTVRWGILGTGRMAETIAIELATLREAGLELSAVASRSPEKAQVFAARHRIARHWDSYAELVADPELDVVYVATPHTLHFENTLACVRAGKAVLCEKPFTTDQQ